MGIVRLDELLQGGRGGRASDLEALPSSEERGINVEEKEERAVAERFDGCFVVDGGGAEPLLPILGGEV